jgi:tRNA G18 (ribose-2'-O)-methylase SpoU
LTERLVRVQRIESLEDPRVAVYRLVRDPALRREGLFLVEGRANVRCLIEGARFRPRSVLVTPAALSGLDDVLPKLPADTPVYLAEHPVMNEIVGFHFHRGVLAAAEARSPSSLLDLPVAANRPSLLVALERVTNGENVGSIFRSAAAFGADGLALCPRCCDPLYRKVVRVSMGAALRLPFARCEIWPGSLEQLRSRGYRVVALDPSPEAIELGEFVESLSASPASPGESGSHLRLVLLLGSEAAGLSPAALERADVRVRIGMAQGADSVNVGTAAGIALYQLAAAMPGTLAS